MTDILFISQSLGGVANSLNLILSNIDKSKYNVTLVAPVNQKLEDRARLAGFRYIRLDMKRNIGFHDFLHLIHIYHIIKSGNYKIIHCHSAKAGVLGRIAAFLSGKPVIYSPRGWSYLSQDKKWKQNFFRIIEQMMIPFTDILLVASKSEADLGIKEVGFATDLIKIVNNSFYPDEIKAVDGLNSPFGGEYILTIGRIVYQKNIEQFIDVAEIVHRRFPEIKFIIKGSGFKETLQSELEENAIRSVKEKGLENTVLFVPWGDKIETLNWMQHCKLYVHTARFEALPNVILEAMALGKAVVSTNATGNRDAVVDCLTGYLTELYDCNSMADRIIEFLSDETKLGLFGETAKRYAYENFDIRKNVKLLENQYNFILSHH